MEFYYYTIVFLSALYVFHKSGVNRLSILIVLIFWEGLFDYFGVLNYYKILIVIYALLLFSQKILKKYTVNERYINIFFLLFSVSFWLSYFIHGGELITILSQYGFKYGMAFLLYHGLKDIIVNDTIRKYLKILLLNILTIQVVLSVFKIIIIGYPVEYHVGSMVHGSGGIAVVMPILGLIFYWVIKNGKFTSKDWIFACSFMLIAIASGKRSPVFLFPLILLLLFFNGHIRYRLSRIFKYAPVLIPVVLILFYTGLRLVPSLNPKGKVWGSFDLKYAVDYSLIYTFGTTELNDTSQMISGRGGSLFLLFSPERISLNNPTKVFFGKGLYEVAVAVHNRFLGGKAYGINYIGLMGEPIRIVYADLATK